MTERARIGILASGNGSNAEAVCLASRSGELDADVAIVICDVPGAPVVSRCEALAVPVFCEAPDSRWESKINHALAQEKCDLVVLAGYMRICRGEFLNRWQGRAINIHPSLLPNFPGRHAIADALAAGSTTTGVTVHYIDEGIDTGPIIAQQSVTIDPNDDLKSLSNRIHEVEHQLLPSTINKLIKEKSIVNLYTTA